MLIREDYFFKKISRVTSEFIILSILAEKEVSHPYEIHEIVHNQILKKYHDRIDNLRKFIKVCEEILDLYHSSEKKDPQYIKKISQELPSPLMKHFSKIFIQKIEKNKDLLSDLEKLKEDAKKILEHRNSGLKIWDHVPSIYQVMNELEKRKLIKEKGTKTIKGRTRKLYEITSKGREEALRMITIFGDLTQVIIPKALLFQDNFNILFQTHLNIVFQLFEKLFPNTTILEVIQQIEASSPKFEGAFDELFPLIDNELLLISLLLEDFITPESIKIDILTSDQQELFKYLLLKRLKKYRDKLDHVISTLE